MGWPRSQRNALHELRSLHADHPDRVVRIGNPHRKDRSPDVMFIDVELSMDIIDIPANDQLLLPIEKVTIAVGASYPEHPPRVFVDHDRFVDVAHVLFGRQFCIYLNPDREWHPNGGVTDALNQTWRLLEDAANGRFDPLTALFHPVGGFNPTTKGTGTAVVHSFPGTEGKALSIGEVAPRTPARVDVGAPGSFPERTTIRNITVTVPTRLPYGLGHTVAELVAAIATAGGPTMPALLGAIQRAAARASQGKPIHLTVAVARSARKADGWHLCCGRIGFDPVTRHALVNAETLAAMQRAIGPDLPMEWYDMNDQRSELAVRRDARRPAHAFGGLTVEVWGCGALGSWMAEILVRAGVAHIRLFDPRGVGAGLLVRQNYVEDDVGHPKATQLKARLEAISDAVVVEAATCSPTRSPSQDCDLIIDATVNEAVAALLSPTANTVVASVATDVESASLGLLVVGSADRPPSEVQDALAPVALARSDLEAFHRFWDDPEPEAMILPAPGCSTPTFHGSAADAMGVASTMMNLLANHVAAEVDGMHLINMPHSGHNVPGHAFLEMPS